MNHCQTHQKLQERLAPWNHHQENQCPHENEPSENCTTLQKRNDVLLTFLKESEAAAERRHNRMLDNIAQQNVAFMEMFKKKHWLC